MDPVEFSYEYLSHVARSNGKLLGACLRALEEQHPNVSQEEWGRLSIFLRQNFLPQFRSKWDASGRDSNRFRATNASWLERRYAVSCSPPVQQSPLLPGPSVPLPGPSIPLPGPSRILGRPPKDFGDCTTRTKRRKIRALQNELTLEILRDAAGQPKFTAERALALLIDNDLSKRTYENIRSALREIGLNPFPVYERIIEAKAKCYPSKIEVSETHASVGLKELLQHTAERLILSLPSGTKNTMHSDVTLVCKWGCDGSSGHSEYKQSFSDPTNSDSSLFITTMVPLKLRARNEESVVFWRNPTPSSTHLCRPVRFELVKETAAVIKAEADRMREEIANLGPVAIIVEDKSFFIDFIMIFSMIDGKILQILNDTPAMQTCSLCGAKRSEMNNLELNFARAVAPQSKVVSMSPLHARIKLMESLLKIPYNLSFKRGSAVGDELKKLKEDTKRRIQASFRERSGLNVDVVRQGAGSSNDGNTSRRFFANPVTVSDITGLDEGLVRRFGTILAAVNCNRALDFKKFERYCRHTAELYVSLYPWYPMPNTLYKVLVHGSSMIASTSEPIGSLSEEAQEAANKCYRQHRLHHSRKVSRIATNEDVIHMMLASSDPQLNRFRRPLRATREDDDFEPALRNLLIDSDSDITD